MHELRIIERSPSEVAEVGNEVANLRIDSATRQSTFGEIHKEAMAAAKQLKLNYLWVFESLLKVESQQVYHQFEVPSLYLYCVELLELSPSVARDFITVVRRSLEVPELAAAVRAKRVTIFKAKKICSVVNSANFKEWIELAETCSTRIVEKAVAQANPKEAVAESLVYASAERLELKLGVSEEWAELLKHTKDLLSQKYKEAVTSEEALFILMSEHCEKNDPVRKALRVKVASPNKSVRPELAGTEASRYRPAKVEHLVNLRDQNQCAYIDVQGKRCDSKRWLDKHHIQHFAGGGKHTVENLETLCSAHHKIKHLQ